MERILGEIIKKLIRCGYDCDAKLDTKYILGQNSDQKGILIRFNELTWTQDQYSRETLPLEMWIGYPTMTDNDVLNIDVFEKLKEIGNKFIYYLRNYEDDNEMQLVQISTSSWDQYFDWYYDEITTSGYHITLNLTKEATTQC